MKHQIRRSFFINLGKRCQLPNPIHPKMPFSENSNWRQIFWGSLLIGLFFFCSGNRADAKLIEAESLLLRILKSNSHISQFYIEVEVHIFDPEAFAPLNERLEENPIPYEIIEKSFTQSIVWVRDEYLAIETMDLEGNPLHIFVKEPGYPAFSKSLQDERIFITEDVVFPYLVLYTKHISYLKSGLSYLGIAPVTVKIEQHQFHNVYQLGLEDENLLIDPDVFRVLEVNRKIQIRGRYYPIKIAFSQWDSRKKMIPETTRFFVDSRLFKEIRVIDDIRFKRIYLKRNSFLRKYRDLLSPLSRFSLETDYAK